MKKIFLVIIFTMAAFALQAQNVTEHSLQGKWSLVYMDTDGLTVDLVKKTYTISQELRDSNPDAAEQIEESLEMMLDQGMEGYMVFDKNTLSETHVEGDETVTTQGAFRVVAGTPALIELTMDGGVAATFEASFEGGNLVMKDTGPDQTLVKYTKVK